MAQHQATSTLSHLRRGMLSLAFAGAAGLLAVAQVAPIHDKTAEAFGPVPAESLMDNDLFNLARKVGDIVGGVAADRRRVKSIGVNVEEMNRQGGGHISFPERKADREFKA